METTIRVQTNEINVKARGMCNVFSEIDSTLSLVSMCYKYRLLGAMCSYVLGEELSHHATDTVVIIIESSTQIATDHVLHSQLGYCPC